MTLSAEKSGATILQMCRRIAALYLTFWRYLIPFAVVGLVVGYYKFDLGAVVLDLLCLTQTFYREAWFILTYCLCLLFFPLFFKIKKVLWLVLATVVVTALARNFLPSSNGNNFLYRDLFLFGQYISSFLMGMIAAKMNWRIPVNKFSFIVVFVCTVGLFGLRFASGMTWMTILVTPCFVCLCSYISQIRHVSAVLCFLGRYSTGMWLVHGYFLYYYMKPLLFNVTTSPVVSLTLLIAYSLALTLFVDFLYKKFSHGLEVVLEKHKQK